MRKLTMLWLLTSALLLSACADPCVDAPGDRSAHPELWLTEHDGELAGGTELTYCSGCHGVDLEGSGTAPGCFSVAVGCHHPVDGSYLSGSQHGPDAKQDMTTCQVCHGEPGGPGDNPRFDGGITGISCESCHGLNLAHPEDWAGPNTTFHYSAGSIHNACTLCHGEDLNGGAYGSSCLDCHSSTTDFTLDCTGCHGYPPDGSSHEGTVTGVYHLYIPLQYHGGCTNCHGVSESVSGGTFAPAANYTLFHQATDTIGDHWDGNIQMNTFTQYDQDNYVCGNCHDYDPYYIMSDSGLPVVLKDMF